LNWVNFCHSSWQQFFFFPWHAISLGRNKGKNDLHRYYYDFSSKKICKTRACTEETFRPIYYKANKDIQIEIFNYNPLKDQLIIENTYSERFLADTGLFAKYLILPGIPEIQSKYTQAGTRMEEQKDRNGRVISKKLVPDCEELSALLDSLDNLIKATEDKIGNYQNFLSRIELIRDDYDYLKQLNVLSASDISQRLNTTFITSIKGDFNPQPSSIESVSSRQLSELEYRYYSAIIESEKKLETLKDEESVLTTDDCSDYVERNNKFNDSWSALKDKLNLLKQMRSDKTLPAFNKTLQLYDLLKKYAVEVPPFITPALTIDKDLHTINVYCKEQGSNEKVLYDNITVEPTKGWKLDIASGIFVTGLYDARYSKDSKEAIDTVQYVSNGVVGDTIINRTYNAIYKEKQTPVSVGGMVFLHAHTQCASLVNYGIYVGFGALFNDQTRWTMSVGGSVIIGKKQRFNINLGGAIAQVERLQQPYSTGTWYPETIDNIPTMKVWKISYLVGFSWNIR